ncbi:MAG: hypothetical protein RLY21_292 [Planctomycetota bacterium]|jgi:hypothetical protein
MIPPTGIHSIPDRAYFAIDLPSSSQTKTLIDGTNAHLAHERENPREESDAFAIGAWVHARLLAPATVEDAFIVTGKIDRRTTEGKAEHAAITKRASLTGARIITSDQVAEAERMVTAVRENTDAARLLNTLTMREITVIGEIGGKPAKAKLDGVIALAGASIIVDIKTTQSADPREFAKSAATFGYYHQAAWYARLLNQVAAPVDDFVIIAVEKAAPYLCAVYRIPTVAMVAADVRLEELAARWWAVQGGDRTGYAGGIAELAPPAWWLNAQGGLL